MARIFLPLPDTDFDVTEVAVPWKLLTEAGHDVVFATEGGATPACDPLLITGVLFGKLGAEKEPIAFYREMEASPSFTKPIAWTSLSTITDYDALFLAGGHAPGMRQYLGSEKLQALIAGFFATDKPIGAICHGVLVAARSKRDGVSVLHGVKTTCLPKYMERSAYLATFWLRGKYYRTYPKYVEDEVKENLAALEDFERGPRELSKRGTRDDDTHAFVVEDGRYVSGRWPGDAYLLAKKLLARL
jgi:putative intracellular protease/amidase